MIYHLSWPHNLRMAPYPMWAAASPAAASPAVAALPLSEVSV
jgi:hypothetical protein